MTETAVRTVRPLGDRVLVRPAKADERKGELYIPEVAREQPMEGEVVATGLHVTSLEKGALVLYGKYAGAEVRVNDETLLMLRVDDLLGVIEEG